MNDVTISDLSFSYPGTDRLILRDVNLHADEGDFVCLLGQSGCGKSTLLRLLAGLETPTEGTIAVGGKPVRGAGLDRSVVFQDYGLFPWMSAGANLTLALKQRYPQKKKDELKQIALRYLSEVGLGEDVFDKYPKELSGGMKQRCAIARSFSLDPPILLMDEPFGALDAVTRARLQDLVLDLWSRDEPKKTVVFVTHDVEEALLLATHIVVLGQSPSQVIFDERLDAQKRPTRKNMFEDPAVLELRNTLVECINNDITRKSEA